ncbi:biosynthetic peptidoglycan transglycosylase [Peptostreptococcus porci]|uniref:transglycosylase domain-containing protein n=1 Tax=Peptostreptococcus porci TaxID=2652282 RepID=UPI002A808FD5|nr:biosynthetic peptidoglycan transglycosylase [Peptostreptococcus porci]MDY4129078.1 biosynthetic peptidoglycan transglycosylase [Peptostreptococcus porci]
MSDVFDNNNNTNNRNRNDNNIGGRSRNRLEEEIYDDIKTYKLKRASFENRKDTLNFSVEDKKDDSDMRHYDISKSNQRSDSRSMRTKSENKNSKIRIKKQQTSGSNTLTFENEKKSRNFPGGERFTYKKDNSYIERERERENRRNNWRQKRAVEVEDIDDDEEYYDDEYDVRSWRFRLLKKIIAFLLIIMVVGGSASFIYVKSIINDMPVLTKKMVLESYINKEPVPLSKIPKNLQNAVISIEDERFYSHKGIDYKSLVRSFVNNLTGNMTQGGSTIDMQVSKNLLTSNEKTLKRKIQDMYNATVLNKIMTKNEILEAYLNNIYLGKSTYGVQAGAKLYFGKNVNELNFGQSTMLAGITNNPNLYQNYEQAKKRQAIVLYKMYELGYIKENVYKAQLYRDTPFKSEIDK